MVLPPAAVQAFEVIALKPWPLQLFMPLQSWLPDLQSDIPLHELTPKQCTVSAANTGVVIDTLESAKSAAAAAKPAVVLEEVIIIVS